MAASASPPSRPAASTRLPGGPPFDRVFQAGSSVANGLVVLRFVPNTLNITRWGFAVSRRMAPAVVRNRTRRRLRVAIRTATTSAPVDIVVIARKPALTASTAELTTSVVRLLARAMRAQP